MKQALSLLLALCSLSCEQHTYSPDSLDRVPPALISVDTSDGEQFIAVIKENNNNSTLSKTELLTIDKMIRQAVTEYNINNDSSSVINLSKYKRQYFISFGSKGEKIVEANFFCLVSKSNRWKERRVSVMDGGKCYFNMLINLTTRKVIEFHIHGEA